MKQEKSGDYSFILKDTHKNFYKNAVNKKFTILLSKPVTMAQFEFKISVSKNTVNKVISDFYYTMKKNFNCYKIKKKVTFFNN